MIVSAEVNDAQIYSCECKSEGGSLTGHARVFILGELFRTLSLFCLQEVCCVEISHVCSVPSGACVSDYLMSLTEKLKFTPVPQRSQCLQLERENSVGCAAQGRETPTILWRRTGHRLTILYCTLVYYSSVHHSTVLYSTLMYATLLHTSIHYSTLHYCTVHYCTPLTEQCVLIRIKSDTHVAVIVFLNTLVCKMCKYKQFYSLVNNKQTHWSVTVLTHRLCCRPLVTTHFSLCSAVLMTNTH